MNPAAVIVTEIKKRSIPLSPDTVSKPNKRPRTNTNEATNHTNSMDTTTTTDNADSTLTSTTTGNSTPWGEWMGSWKINPTQIDQEAERIDRQKAAFGGETISRLKDLNILILGVRGVGIETAKNLILTNVGSVTLVDDEVCTIADLGTNFYIKEGHVGVKTRAEACLEELRTLNPYCRVDIHSGPIQDLLTSANVLNTQRPLGVVVISQLLPKVELCSINETCRSRGIATCLAVTNGVTSSLFSDFGIQHEITDATGEPTQTLAVSQIEVLTDLPDMLQIEGVTNKGGGDGKKVNGKQRVVVVTVAKDNHGLEDGDVVALDDMRGVLESWNGKTVTVKRVAIASPTEAKLDTNDVAFKEALKLPTSVVLANFGKQYDFYKQKHEDEQSATDLKKKFQFRSITMFNRLALVLTDEDGSMEDFESYQAGGLLNQVRPSITQSYSSLRETLDCATPVPQMLRGEEWEEGKGIEIHLCIAAVLDFQEEEGHWPRIHNDEDAEKVLSICKKISKSRQDTEACWSQKVSWGFPSGEPRELDTKRILRYAKLFGTELTGFCAFLGGAIAQEVLKKSGKFTPLKQWIHHDEQILVCDDVTNTTPTFGSRYDYQISIMGKDFQNQMANQKVFLVGCGALGCEYLKGLALMGVATSPEGKITVTDMDRIEVSNLSRQFLFRQEDVSHPKSVRGALAVQKWNPNLNITAMEQKVGNDTEDIFTDDFWRKLDICWNALDNVMARQYTDSRCLFYSKPLLESGTLGTKCNHEIVLPYRTSTYNDGNENDSNETQIAMCTLRSFPYLPNHCIEFAKQSYFSDYFEFGPEQYETFRKDKATFFEQLESMDAGEQYRSLALIQSFLDMHQEAQSSSNGKMDVGLCVKTAYANLMGDYRTSILNLCHSADAMESSSGKKFWTGTKRRPKAIDWNCEEDKAQLMEYLYSTAGLYASVWGLECIRDRNDFTDLVLSLNLEQPEWNPPSQNVNLSDEDEEGGDSTDKAEKLKADLYSVDTLNLPPANPQDFEKDDDLNFHIDYLTIATNLRAWNYDIKASPRHTVKVTAGRIIPALATTTAMVCGLVNVEYCKLVLGLANTNGRDVFLNSNINLAAGSGNFTTFCPDPPINIETGLDQPKSFTSWDKIEIVNDKEELSVQALMKRVESTFGVKVSRIFASGNQEDKALYNAREEEKLHWEIDIDDTGKASVSSNDIYTAWPQIRMAVQMLSRLPPTSNQRKLFATQVDKVKLSLAKTKEAFMRDFEGKVSQAYYNTYLPKEEEDDKMKYFDKVFEARNYVVLDVDCYVMEGEEKKDITLPPIKYVYSS